MNRSRGLLILLASATSVATSSVSASPASAAPPTGGPAQVALAVSPPPSAEPPAAAPPSDGPGPVEGPAPEVAEFDDPIVAALQPVSGGLTSKDVAERSVARSPMLAAKQAEVEAAEAQLDQTLYQFIPRVEASASYVRLSQAQLNFDTGGEGFIVGAQNEGILGYGPCGDIPLLNCVVDQEGEPVAAVPLEFDIEDPPLNGITLQAQLGVPISDYIARLPTAKKAGKAQIRAAEYAAKAEELTTQKDARLAYYDWVRAVASKVALQESLERTEARLLDAEAGFEAGVASKADVMRLDAAVATLTAATIRAENFQILAEQALAIQMGDDKFERYQIGEDLFTAKAPLADVDDLPTMIQESEDQRYEMRAFAASTESLDYAIKTTRAGYYPRLDGFAEATYANPNQRFFPLEPVFNGSWSAGVSLTFVMNEAINASAKVKELEANQRGLDAQREALRRGLAIEVASAHAERQSVLAELEYIERANESAAEGYRVAVDLYQVGDATTTDILDAEYERVDATLRNINAKIDLIIADIKLMYAIGRLEPVGASEG
ncbi:outer membrane channel protein [Enhygromyxa salina]|uniref:Outer membrane channel protein n=1 Tax=Enhygromyxa salina TaxID=215803 RepID=A0A2S9XE63_9BACT|nr:TolC family protein [Enhygromyxa salina]PRP91050.1 outer membrane channel protein [Enhygromyxa salina]